MAWTRSALGGSWVIAARDARGRSLYPLPPQLPVCACVSPCVCPGCMRLSVLLYALAVCGCLCCCMPVRIPCCLCCHMLEFPPVAGHFHKERV